MVEEVDRMKQRKDTSSISTWNTYEAILDNVHFEWDDHLREGDKICKQDCIEYLDRYFPEYIMKKFYLKREHQRFGTV